MDEIELFCSYPALETTELVILCFEELTKVFLEDACLGDFLISFDFEGTTVVSAYLTWVLALVWSFFYFGIWLTKKSDQI